MINIFSGDFTEASTVKNILENANIRVFVLNELMSGIEPVISAGGFNPVVLQVNDSDFEKAREVIGDYENGKLTR